MKPIMNQNLLISLLLPAACLAQTWEVGAAGGYSFYRNVGVSSRAGSAKAGFGNGAAFSAVGTHNVRDHWGGEFRYLYGANDPKLYDGVNARLSGDTQAFVYDFLVYGAGKEAPMRPFLAAGAGGKLFRGTGPEIAFQPGSNIAVLSHTSEVKPVVSFGGGLKFAMGKWGIFRLDFRDHASPLPQKVIAPMPPTGRTSGWLHDFVVLAGFSLAVR